jgi:hypothetical protein
MKSEKEIKKAFAAMQSQHHRLTNGEGTDLNPALTHNLVALAWILDLLPLHIDEVTTERYNGDAHKDLNHPIEPPQITKAILNAEVEIG